MARGSVGHGCEEETELVCGHARATICNEAATSFPIYLTAKNVVTYHSIDGSRTMVHTETTTFGNTFFVQVYINC